MLNLIDSVAKRTKELPSIRDSLLHLAAAPPSSSAAASLIDGLTILVDWGAIADAYTLAERLARTWTPPVACESWKWRAHAFFRALMMHCDLTRGRNLDKASTIICDLQSSSDPFLCGHALSAQGLLYFLEGKLDDAINSFQKARQSFVDANRQVDSLKTNIREMMVLRAQNKHDEAQQQASHVIRAALLLGVDAISPLLCALSIKGQATLRSGRPYEGLRHLRDAARLANAMPPSSSTAWTFFQYGNALLEHKKPQEAMTWLEKAEPIQKVCDPIAHFSTKVALLHCCRRTREWKRALRLIPDVIATRFKNQDPNDIQEMYRESILTYWESADHYAAKETLATARAWAEGLASNQTALNLFLSLANTIETDYTAWVCVRTGVASTATPTVEIRLDFQSRQVFSRGPDGFAHLSFENGSATAVVLEHISQCGVAEIHRDSFAQLLQGHSRSNTAASLRRKSDRIISALTAIGGFSRTPGGIAVTENVNLWIKPAAAQPETNCK